MLVIANRWAAELGVISSTLAQKTISGVLDTGWIGSFAPTNGCGSFGRFCSCGMQDSLLSSLLDQAWGKLGQ